MSVYLFITLALALGKGIAYDKFDRDCVREHNRLRTLHGTQPLAWSESVAADAQKWVEYLAQNDKIEHDSETLNSKDQGENIAWFTPPQLKCENEGTTNCVTCTEIVTNWYNEVQNYNFQEGSSKNMTLPVKHFAQVVWNGSMEVGVGTAISKTFGFIAVARYYPQGATGGTKVYKKNVFLKRQKSKITKVPSTPAVNSPTLNSTTGTSKHNVQDSSSQNLLQHITCGTATASHQERDSLEVGQFPWLVGLRYQNRLGKSNIFCRGALLDKEWVATAAHCFNAQVGPSFKLKVVLSEFDDQNKDNEEVVVDAEVISHPLHHRKTKDYDVALVKLKPPLQSFTDYKRPLCLPDGDVNFAPGQICVVAGFGGNHGSRVRRVNVPLVSLNNCRVDYNWLTERMTCAGNTEGKIDTCRGDAGSPLICSDRGGKFYLAGIVSHSKKCGQAGSPGVYTDVKFLMPWIRHVMRSS